MFRSEIDVHDDWLGLEHAGGGRSSFKLTPHLARSDGKLFGGTAVAVATAVIEAISSRPTLWVTVQFVASAQTNDGIDVHTEVLASGRRVWQLRVTATVESRSSLLHWGRWPTSRRVPSTLISRRCPKSSHQTLPTPGRFWSEHQAGTADGPHPGEATKR